MSAGIQRQMPLAGGGRALFTERVHGNLSSVGGRDAEHGAGARERLRELIGLSTIARGYQVHGSTVRRLPAPLAVGDPGGDPPKADGQATSVPRQGVMVLAADCLPVALGCDGAIAAIHAGWRGLLGGVLEEGVGALAELAPGREIGAVIGPCAGPCCYEVGEEVHSAFGGAARRGRNIDLRAIAHERLHAAGVTDVADLEACTICDERYFSHRREGTDAGRQAVIAWLS
jgi:YfiH family protein